MPERELIFKHALVGYTNITACGAGLEYEKNCNTKSKREFQNIYFV